jgi:PhnB protein
MTYTLIPYLCVRGAGEAIAFYEKAFGAKELYRLVDPSGKVGHAELTIGDQVFYLSDEYPGWGAESPLEHTGAAVTLSLVAPDVDAVVKMAEDAGAKVERPPKDEFYGHRSAALRDPFGHRWMVSTEIEKVSPEEMQRRFDEMCKQGK